MTGKTAKVEAGKIYTCKHCGKTPAVGDTRYYQNLGNKDAPQWIGCTDLECFKKQGGTYDPAAVSSGGRFSSSKFPIEKAAEVFALAVTLTEQYKEKHKDITPEIEAQFTESMFKTLAGSFK